MDIYLKTKLCSRHSDSLLGNIFIVFLHTGCKPASVTPAVVIAPTHRDCNVQIALAGGANCPVAFPKYISQRNILGFLAVSSMCVIMSVKSSQVQVSIHR